MRTNTLLLAAAIGVAGASSAFAQVYSVNAVGYVTADLKAGFQIVANPLDAGAGNNTVSKLLTGVPNGTIVYQFASSKYVINAYDVDLGGWDSPDMVMAPGEGFFVRIPAGASAKVTFVGEVLQGSLKNSIPAGFSIKASQVPQSGALQTVLGFPVVSGDIVYRFNNTKNGYDISAYDTDLGGWDPSEPVPAVGEGFFVRKMAAIDWTRNFSVN